jgi:hypothetical protein
MRKSLLGITQNLAIALRVVVLLSVAWLPVQAYTYYSYSRLSPTLDYMESDFLLADMIASWVGVPFVIAVLGTVVLYFIWLYRAVANLNVVSPGAISTSPGWAVGWYFVPFASVFMPYKTMVRVWKASHKGEPPGHRLVAVWWLTWLAWVVAANGISATPATVGEYVNQFPAQIPSDLLSVALSALTLLLVLRIGAAYEHNVAEWQVTAPSPPAGWYPDPEGTGGRRFWTGDAWGGLEGDPLLSPDAAATAKSV